MKPSVKQGNHKLMYRWLSFSTAKKSWLRQIPGHVEYTRNMVTGASTASFIILIDARKGVIEQTYRQFFHQ
jgi:sulfate adenylyltransferase subunit 1